MPTIWWGRQNAAPLKFDPKPSEAAFSAVFRTSTNGNRKYLTSDVMSVWLLTADQIGMCDRVKFGDSRLNRDRIIRLVADISCFTPLPAIFNYSLQPTGNIHVISGRYMRLTLPFSSTFNCFIVLFKFLILLVCSFIAAFQPLVAATSIK